MKTLRYNTFKIMLPMLVVMMSITSCGDYLDINTDPNNPLQAKLSLVVPTVETAIFEAFGNGSGGLSDLTSQFVHQTVQRGQSNFYFIGGDEFAIANAWNNLYAGALMDIEQIINVSTERESWHYLGLAQVLKAYTFSMIVDVWGKAAFSEFGQGTANPYAKYDEGQDIYPQLFTLLDEATANLAKTAQESVGAEDLIFGGTEASWIAFANSLKLKLYNQVRKTDLYNATAVADIMANKAMIASSAGGFRLLYGASVTPDNRHPLYKKDYIDANANYIDPYFWLIMRGDFEEYGLPVMNDVLEGIQDPRLPYYFYNQLNPDETPQNSQTTTAYFDDYFLSIWFASFNIDPNEGFDQAQSQTLVGLYPSGGAYDDSLAVTGGAADGQNPGNGGVGYQRLYAHYAHLYTLAELTLEKNILGPGGKTTRTLFAEALAASFAEVNEMATMAGVPVIPAVDPPPAEPTDPPDNFTYNDVEDYVKAVMDRYDATTTNAEKLELILTEKWIASFGFGMDSYTDFRRTGYPIMFDAAADDNPFTILNRVYPVSFPYFIDDLQINPHAAAQRNPGTDEVFWDVD